jgi:hypothetical protein
MSEGESSAIQVSIDPEAVNKMVSEAILKSAIGNKIKSAIEGELLRINNSYSNPYVGVIQSVINDIIRDLVATQHSDAIKEQVHKLVTEEKVNSVVETIFKRLMDR